MTEQKLTSFVTKEIKQPRIATLFMKKHVSNYLAQFIGTETTVKNAALEVGVKLNVMAYWTNRFLKLNLIQITRIETRAGSAIKYYQAVADEFIFPVVPLEGLDNTELLQRIMQRDYDRFSQNVAAVGFRLTEHWQLRLYRDQKGACLNLQPMSQPAQTLNHFSSERRPLHDWAEATMPADQADKFYIELQALFERFRANTILESGLPRFIMHIGFVEASN